MDGVGILGLSPSALPLLYSQQLPPLQSSTLPLGTFQSHIGTTTDEKMAETHQRHNICYNTYPLNWCKNTQCWRN